MLLTKYLFRHECDDLLDLISEFSEFSEFSVFVETSMIPYPDWLNFSGRISSVVFSEEIMVAGMINADVVTIAFMWLYITRIGY